VFGKPVRQFEVLEERPLREAPHGLEGRLARELASVPEAEPKPGPAGTPAVEVKQRGRIVELQAKCTGCGLGIVEGGTDGRQSIRGKKRVGVQKEQHVPGGVLRPLIHLRSPACGSLKHLSPPRLSERPCLVLRPAVHDDRLERIVLCAEAAQCAPEGGRLVERRNDD
jgi:hypothetical protein